MSLVVASAEIGDEEFLASFHSCELPASSFRHGDHLRLAWLLLHRNPFEEAHTLVREGIRRYAAHLGVPHLYHETITIAWVKLLATHREASFAEFIAANEHRLNLDLLHRFWSPGVLDSAAARSGWVPPDKAVLPF
jgi:CDP-diacylglycerol--glycerol-3-phosphate 3-phosphatidyltransferase